MSKKEWLIIAAIIVIGGSLVGFHLIKNNDRSSMDHSNTSMNDSSSSYTVNLTSYKNYPSNKPVKLDFDIKQDSNTFKSFAIDNTKLMHLIVVRKDRSYFQHVHPEYDEKTGMFTMSNFQFPTDGQYRIFANFATTDAKKDAMGMIETEAPFVDVTVGDTSKVSAQPLGADKLTTAADGLTATMKYPTGGDSAGGSSQPTFYAGNDGMVTVEIDKDGTAFKNLQEYLGNLAHMVVLGPNLEFIHAHPMLGDVNNQTGFIPFMVTFPSAGQYKLYLQTQSNNNVSTFDFNVTVQATSQSTSDSSSMQGMDHMSH